MNSLKLLDTIALLKDLPAERLTLVEPDYPLTSLPIGLVGTIVHIQEQNDESLYWVEFSDSDGCEYAMATLKASEILVLRYELVAA
jgi:Domain of unknown function (DUF4926)